MRHMRNATARLFGGIRQRPLSAAFIAILVLFGIGRATGATWLTDPFQGALRVLALTSDTGVSGAARAIGAPPLVTVSKPAERQIIEWDDYTGRFEAVERVEVRARVAGYLDSVHFTDGQQIAKGDLLFTIDPRPFERALEQARAEVAAAQTKIDNSNLDVVRGQPLLDRKVLSQKTFDDRANLKREAEASLKIAQAKLHTAELDITFTKVLAPIAGRISRTLVTSGNYVGAGGAATPTLLTTIISTDPLYLYFDVSEANAIKYRRLRMAGREQAGTALGAPVEIGLPDEQGFPHRGAVDFTEARLDADTGTLRARALVENKLGLFAAGMFARVRLAGSPPGPALLVPDDAIGSDQVSKYVVVVADDGSVKRRVVVLGNQVAGLRVIRSGLTASDWVVVNGLQRVRPGQKVDPQRQDLKVTEAEKPAGASPVSAAR